MPDAPVKTRVPWNKGKVGVQKCSEETRRKMSLTRTGKVFHSNEFKKKLAERNKTPEHRAKVSAGLMGKKWTLEKRAKLSGPNAHLWRGGITEKNKMVRSSIEYKEWRKAVFERDNYTCVWCGVHTGNGHRVELQADHIKSFALHEELRFSIENGRTLCRNCHIKTDTWGVNVRHNRKLTITYA